MLLYIRVLVSALLQEFRILGPKGVWTLEKKGEKPALNISFDDAQPTLTHMALLALVEHGYVQYIVTQNIDGLHLKSGLSRRNLAEVHGNMFIEQCRKCRRQFICPTASKTVGQKTMGYPCQSGLDGNSRSCRSGILHDTVLDWEDNLPEPDFQLALMHSTMADLNITLGTTLQIVPSGNLPLKNLKTGGKLVICNLQPTKHNKHAHLIISTYTDQILSKLCKLIGVEIPKYSEACDPTKCFTYLEWALSQDCIKSLEKTFKEHQAAIRKDCHQLQVPKFMPKAKKRRKSET
ncbi:NAD-dependent protein deacetylase Sirt6 isoform X2 [Scaptodrosophila lebanonensis]|uniref:protein acetyllysine N-acetyltransferase n=1 Tax=Drosophila lebanonensis TaxID=7225 RepID=A0A6J2U7Q8_DROLE|nr:NAD-dependent protein deacetylase Sirt6 isoform X2 [Scaptodrosophila lebanonensis]